MLNQWWSYNFNEEETQPWVFTKIFHFPSRKIRRKMHMIFHWYIQQYKFLNFGKTNTLICEYKLQTLTNELDFPRIYGEAFSNAKFSHDLTPLIKAKQNEKQMFSLSLREKLHWNVALFGKIDKVFQWSCKKTYPPATKIICIFYGGFISASHWFSWVIFLSFHIMIGNFWTELRVISGTLCNFLYYQSLFWYSFHLLSFNNLFW